MVSAPCSDNSATCAVRAMALTIRDLILEAHDTLDRFWFVRGINIVEQTQATVVSTNLLNTIRECVGVGKVV